MGFQSFLRLLGVVCLNVAFFYEMFFLQGISSFRWYDWLIVIICILGVFVSIGCEVSLDEFDKYDWDGIGDSGYVAARFFNLLVSGGLLWKSLVLQQLLPISLTLSIIVVIVIGLFSVFNFYYWIISLVSSFAIFYVSFHLHLEGWWYYVSIIGIVVVSIIVMFFLALSINDYRTEIIRRKRLQEENEILIRKQLEQERKENKWWKFW